MLNGVAILVEREGLNDSAAAATVGGVRWNEAGLNGVGGRYGGRAEQAGGKGVLAWPNLSMIQN